MTTNNKRYFKIGIFVIISTALLIAAILFFGAARFIESKTYVESYFNESVQGLSVGSAVKYRGIVVGHVDAIDLLSNVYTPQEVNNTAFYNSGIYIRIAITAKNFSYFNAEDAEALQQLIKSGLRIRLTPQGLTGFAFLEITFLDPTTNPVVPATWKTRYPYIPSAISTYNRISEAMEDMLSSVDSTNSKNLLNNISDLTTTSKKAIEDANLPQLSKEFSDSLQTIKETATSYKQLADQIDKLMKDGKIDELLANMNAVSNNLKSVTLQAQKTLEQTSAAMNHANQLMTDSQGKLAVILDNAETATENLKEVSNNVKSNPSQLLMGSNPPRLDPSKL